VALSRFLLAPMRAGPRLCDAESVPLRCLIVDDNPSFLEAARVLLERQGASVVGTATTVHEALVQTHDLRPDVALVDVMLGDESGLDLARRLEDAGPPVVLISTHSTADLEDLLSETPAAGFLPKSELSASAIARILDGQSSASSRGAAL
jgi:DNA-binding NarL/FixJ family response regulator